jgi:hypothetical protein
VAHDADHLLGQERAVLRFRLKAGGLAHELFQSPARDEQLALVLVAVTRDERR